MRVISVLGGIYFATNMALADLIGGNCISKADLRGFESGTEFTHETELTTLIDSAMELYGY